VFSFEFIPQQEIKRALIPGPLLLAKVVVLPLLRVKGAVLGDKLRVNSKASKHTPPCRESGEQHPGTSP